MFAFVRIGALLVFLALAGLLTVLWRKELAMKRQRARLAGGSDLRTARSSSAMNDLMRRMLWLPEQASTFADRASTTFTTSSSP